MDADITVTIGMSEPDHGSDITYLDTTAKKDGNEWVIDGTKCWITNSTFADAIIVFARTDGEDGDAHGISAFVVDEDNPGWERGKTTSRSAASPRSAWSASAGAASSTSRWGRSATSA